MAGIPRTEKWVNSAAAGTSFVTYVEVLNDNTAGVHIIFDGLDDVDGYVRLKGQNSSGGTPDTDDARNLHVNASTMTTASSSFLFNVADIGFEYLVLEYDAGSNTTGTITAHLTRKQV